MPKITHEEYQKMWFALHEGIITEQEWRVFCDALFDQTLEENKDVMVRLASSSRKVKDVPEAEPRYNKSVENIADAWIRAIKLGKE